MKQRAAYAIVLASALGLAVMLSGPASAQSRVTVTADRTQLVSGQELTVRATSPTPCDWGITFDGVPRTKEHSTTFVTRFTAPVVTSRSRIRVVGICVDDPRTGRTARTTAASPRDPQAIRTRIPRHWISGLTVTVDPPGTVVSAPGGGHHPHGVGGIGLPNTGGPRWWLLLLGLGCVITGSVAVGASQRRTALA